MDNFQLPDNLPDDPGADHLAHLDADIQKYEQQIQTLQTLKGKYEKALSDVNERLDYVQTKLKLAQKTRQDAGKTK